MSNIGNTAGSSTPVTGPGLQVVFAGGNNITLSQSTAGSSATVTIIGAAGGGGNAYVSATSVAGGSTAGTVTSAAISSTLSLIAGTNVTLSQASNAAITFIGPQFTAGAGLAVNTSAGSQISYSLSAAYVGGFGISSITAGGATSGTTTLASGNIELAAGSNITLSSSAGVITVIGPAVPPITSGTLYVSATSVAGGSTAGTVTSAAIQSTLSLIAGTNVTLSQASNNAITFIAPSFTTSGAGISLNTSAGSVISVGLTGVQSNVSITTGGGATSGTTALITSGALVLVAGNNITLSQGSGTGTNSTLSSGSNAIVISAPNITSGTLYVSATSVAGGSTAGTVTSAAIQSTLSLIAGTNLTLSQASNNAITFIGPQFTAGAGLAVNTSAGSQISYSFTSTFQSAVIISASGGGTTAGSSGAITSGSLILCAGNNITLSQTTGTSINSVTIIGPTVPTATNFSLNGTSSSVSLIAGPNISFSTAASNITISGLNAVSLVGAASTTGTFSINSGTGISFSTNGGGPGVTILTTGSAVTAFAISSITAGGSTSGTTTAASGEIQLVAGSNITLSSSAGAITIIGGAGAGGAAGTNTFQAGTGSVSGTALSLNIQAGNNVTLSTSSAAGALSVTIGDLPAKLSLWQNMEPGDAGQPVLTQSGTVTSWSSSMFLQRIFIPAAMTLTEMDIAMGITFPNSSSAGAGTLSQYFQLFSFPAGNTTSLVGVLSASSAYTWTTGNTTVAGSASISQFQGGWSIPLIHPLTFAGTSIPAGEYVAGHILNFSQASATWTVNIYGAANSLTNSTTYSGVTTTAQTTLAAISAINTTGISGLSNAGTLSYHVLSNAGTAVITLVSNTATMGTISGGTITTATTFHPSAAVETVFTVAPTQAAFTAFSVAPTQITAVSTVSGVTATGISSLSLSTASFVPQYLTIPNFVYQGTGSSSLYVGAPTAFVAGVTSLGTTSSSLALASVTYSGTIAAAIPYMQLVGS